MEVKTDDDTSDDFVIALTEKASHVAKELREDVEGRVEERINQMGRETCGLDSAYTRLIATRYGPKYVKELEALVLYFPFHGPPLTRKVYLERLKTSIVATDDHSRHNKLDVIEKNGCPF